MKLVLMEVSFAVHQKRVRRQVSLSARIDHTLKRRTSLVKPGQPDQRLPGRKIQLGRRQGRRQSARLSWPVRLPVRLSSVSGQSRTANASTGSSQMKPFASPASTGSLSSDAEARLSRRRIAALKSRFGAQVSRLATIRALGEILEQAIEAASRGSPVLQLDLRSPEAIEHRRQQPPNGIAPCVRRPWSCPVFSAASGLSSLTTSA